MTEQGAVPHRGYEMSLQLGADSWRDLLSILNHIRYELQIKADAGEHEAHIVSGGYGSGYVLTIKHDPDVTHDSWYADIQAWLDQKERDAAAPE